MNIYIYIHIETISTWFMTGFLASTTDCRWRSLFPCPELSLLWQFTPLSSCFADSAIYDVVVAAFIRKGWPDVSVIMVAAFMRKGWPDIGVIMVAAFMRKGWPDIMVAAFMRKGWPDISVIMVAGKRSNH